MRLSRTKALVGVALFLITALVWSACGGSSGMQPGTPSYTPSLPIEDDKALFQKGAALYQANCQTCHGGATGGKLKDLPPPHNANGHTWHHADQQLTEMVLNGISFSVEEQKMPAFKDKLSKEDIQAILAYIKTWWTEEQREWQKKATENWDR